MALEEQGVLNFFTKSFTSIFLGLIQKIEINGFFNISNDLRFRNLFQNLLIPFSEKPSVCLLPWHRGRHPVRLEMSSADMALSPSGHPPVKVLTTPGIVLLSQKVLVLFAMS